LKLLVDRRSFCVDPLMNSILIEMNPFVEVWVADSVENIG
jgi:hypothetical protein